MAKDPDAERGIHYMETLNVGTVAWPDPERMRRINDEWAVSDIVERLRWKAPLGMWSDGEEAAAEIERLEFERDEHRDAARAYRAEVERLRAEVRTVRLDHLTTLGELQEAADEIERLRAAGDALVEAIKAVSCAGLQEDMDRLMDAHNAWQEARRG